MPLSQRVNFKTTLKKASRLQIPSIIRWQYKMEPGEVLKVTVNVVAGWFTNKETFMAKMRKDGCIAVPKLVLALLKRDEPSLEGYAIDVTLEPA